MSVAMAHKSSIAKELKQLVKLVQEQEQAYACVDKLEILQESLCDKIIAHVDHVCLLTETDETAIRIQEDETNSQLEKLYREIHNRSNLIKPLFQHVKKHDEAV